MRTGKKEKNRIKDNRGISLVELIVVIAISATMIGVVSLGVGIMFTRDANYVAVRIDDELAEARMLSMSRNGNFTYFLHYDNDNPASGYIMILNGDATRENNTEYKKIMFGKSVQITVTGTGMPAGTPTSGNIGIVFSKAKGSVQEVGSINPASPYKYTKSSNGNGVYTIKVVSTKNSAKTNTVTLTAATGRHYTEK